jgi:DNA-binding NarL/FixJ family response regulator
VSANRVLVADDHPSALAVRHALPGVQVACAGTVAEAEELVTQRSDFRSALLDLMLPDACGFSGLLQLRIRFADVPIAVITAREEVELASAALELGAVAFLFKSMPPDQLAEALRIIGRGDPVFPRSAKVTDASAVRERIAELTQAQRRVLFTLANGRANKQIAHDLAITEATVKAHLTAILRRLRVTNRMQAMLMLRALSGHTTA